MQLSTMRTIAIAVSGLLVGHYLVVPHPIPGIIVAVLIGFYLWTEGR